jgi:multiple sugar transport system permease protein
MSTNALRLKVRRARFHVFMVPISLIWCLPIVFTVIVSFRSFADIIQHGLGALPHSFTTSAYSTAFNGLGGGGEGRALLNSALITVPTVVSLLLLSSMAAFALSRYRIPGRRAIVAAMLTGNLLPPQVVLVPVVKMVQSLGIFNHLVAPVLVQIGFGMGFYTFVLYGFMRGLPEALTEAAYIDGASPVRIYWRIVVPLVRPALAGLAALAATWTFSDFIFAISTLQSSSTFPVTVFLFNFQTLYISSWNVIAAGAVVAALPTAAIFFVFQRQMISGLLLGATK